MDQHMTNLTKEKTPVTVQSEGRLSLKKWYKQFKILAEEAGVPQVVNPDRTVYKRPWKKGVRPIDALDEVLRYVAEQKAKREAEDLADALRETKPMSKVNLAAFMGIAAGLNRR